MSRPRVAADVVGLAACAALAWGLRGLVLTGECGGAGYPPCPPEADPYFYATVTGVVVSIFAVTAGGRLVVPFFVLAFASGLLWGPP